MMALLATLIVTTLAFPGVCAVEADNTDVASSCQYSRHFSFEGGNMSCPDSAPVLSVLETTAPEGPEQNSLPTTNWTMVCDCPEWSLANTDESAEWIGASDARPTRGFSRISCLRNQYLSGLAYTIDPEALTYVWWGRCTNFPVGYTTEESHCWESSTILAQGSNRSLSLPGEKVVVAKVKLEYPNYIGYDYYNTQWRCSFCTVIDVKCPNPRITNGYTELSATSSDDFIAGISEQSSKGYNESIQIHCRQGFYMEGPSVATCQANGEWSQLPTCRACKSIRYCKIHSCSNGASSRCLKCKPYTSTGYQVALNRNGKKCRVVPYINRTQITFLFVYVPGQTIRMDCPSYGIPAPEIIWFSHTLNQSVTDVINSSRLHFFSNGSLELSDLEPEDEALYSCTATNSVGKDRVYLLVINEETYRFYRTPIAPTINQSTVILFFDTNEHAMLHCRASGTPSPWIHWYKLENEQLHSMPPHGILRIKKYTNGSLEFAPILRQDWGIYACEAVNDYGHDVAMWIVCVGDSCGGTYSGGVDDPPPHLFIEFAPIIIQWTKVHIVSEGNSLSVPCVASGNPPPLIEWRRGSAVISESDTLTLQQVSVHDTGIYSCVARNHMGKTSREMAVIIETVQLPTQPDSSPSMPSTVMTTDSSPSTPSSVMATGSSPSTVMATDSSPSTPSTVVTIDVDTTSESSTVYTISSMLTAFLCLVFLSVINLASG